MRKINIIQNTTPSLLVKEDDNAFRIEWVDSTDIDLNHLLADKVEFTNYLLVSNGYEPMTAEETEWLSTLKISIAQPSIAVE